MTLQLVAFVVGAVVIFFAFIAMVYATLYKKTTSNRAFVRTGSGGAKVFMDSGGLVIPIMHQITWISMESMKLEIARIGKDALITKDKLRADVEAQFYVKVPPESEQILQAARSLGSRALQADDVKELIKDKLISALRSVSATKALMELHEDREGFGMDVFNALKDDLKANGLQLESVAISQLDMTKKEFFDNDNYFDAQGLRLMTDTIETAKKEENDIKRQREIEIEQMNVEADKRKLALQKEREIAEAEQERDVANERALRKAETEKYRIEREQEVEEADVAKQYAIERAKIEKDIKLVEENKRKEEAEVIRKQAIEEAEVRRALAVEQANIEREKATEVARIEKQVRLVEESKREEEAEAERIRIAAEKEKAETERAKIEAERAAEIELIDVRKAAEEDKIKQQVAVDVEAYEIQRRAVAKYEASEKEAQAIERLAEANLKQSEASAEGERRLIQARNEISAELLHQEVLLKLIQTSPELMEALMIPAEKISEIKVLNVNGINGSSNEKNIATGIIDTLLKTGAALPVLKQLVQFGEVNDLVEKVPGLKEFITKEDPPAVSGDDDESENET